MLKRKFRKTFDIAKYTKRVFFRFRFGVLHPGSPPLAARSTLTLIFFFNLPAMHYLKISARRNIL
jgi:hypothetical protein